MKTYSKMVTIGDSIIDNGRGAALTSQICTLREKPEEATEFAPKEFYWEGRLSNGQTYAEHVAQKLGIKLENYATANGYSGHGSLCPWVDMFIDTGGKGQVGDYLLDYDFKIAEDALHYIYLGANDPFALHEDPLDEEIEEAAKKTGNHIEYIVRQILESGGKYFAIGLMDMSPFDIMDTNEDSLIKKYITVSHKTVVDNMEEIKAEYGDNFQYVIIDNLEIMKKVLSKKEEYGFKELVLPYIQSEAGYQLSFKTAPDDHMYWDEYHFTSKTHKIWSDYVYRKLEEL